MNVLLGFEILKHLKVGWQEERVGSIIEERVQNHEEIVEIKMKLVQILLPNLFIFKKEKKKN